VFCPDQMRAMSVECYTHE